MNATIVYFTILEKRPNETAAWGAVIIDDGEMESLSDVAQTELQCALNGLIQCLNRVPRSTPTIIRSTSRIILKMENSWINQWQTNGWEQEVDKLAIEEFIQTIDNRKIQWFHPPFADPIDRRVDEMAKSTQASRDQPTPPLEKSIPEVLEPIQTTLSDPEIVSNARILAYVDAISDGNLGAWSFALIDKPSKLALFTGNAHRHSTISRALLQGCIAVLTTLKDRQHSVEIRTVNSELVALINSLINAPNLETFSEFWSQDSAFVSQLSYWVEQCSITARLLTKTEQECDSAIQETYTLCVDSISSLNQGHSAEHIHRRTHYPLETLTR